MKIAFVVVQPMPGDPVYHGFSNMMPACRVGWAERAQAERWAEDHGPKGCMIVAMNLDGILKPSEVESTNALPRDTDGNLLAVAWPGGYDVVYWTEDQDCFCAKCARKYEDEHGFQGGDPDNPLTMYQTSDWIESYTACDECGVVIVKEPEDDNPGPTRGDCANCGGQGCGACS